MIVDGEVHGMSGAGEGGGDRSAVAGLPFEAEIARRLRRELRCAGGAGSGECGYRRQRRIIDRDPLDGVERPIERLGDDQRDRLADIAHPVIGQQRLRHKGERLSGVDVGLRRRPQRL